MAEFSQVLGSMLRDIARARVRSDVFSGDVSLEYLGDEVMKMFPVPRAEIGAAEVDMALAVTEVSAVGVDLMGTARTSLEAGLADLSNRILGIPVRSGSEGSKPLGEELANERDRFAVLFDKKTRRLLTVGSEAEVEALVSDPGSFSDRMNGTVLRSIREAIKESDRQIPIGQEPQEVLRREFALWTREVSAVIGAAIARQEKDGVLLDVAVTKAQLAEVPDAALSRVHVSVVIKNYEWVEFEDVDGGVKQKLVER